MRDALLIDDHPIVRKGISGLLEQSFPDITVTESVGGPSVLDEICKQPWAFVVLDMNLPGQNGLDILKKAKVNRPDVPIIVFSLYSEEQYAARALRAGAKAYISKDRPPLDLVDAIKTVLKGGHVESPSTTLPRAELSDREVQVLSLLTKGMTRKEIARYLHIHEKTVSTYRARLLHKLHMHTIVDLIRYAAEEGLVD